MKDLESYLDRSLPKFQEDLFALLRIPSVSTHPDSKADVRRAAEWVLNDLVSMGLSAELWETTGHPVIFAETPPVPGRPIALVYGHYDVQPPDPLGEWTSPPFDPTVRNGNVYARGATDDKGQMLTHVKSVQTWLNCRKSLPLQVKFLIEGEEEIGSDGLFGLIPQRKDRLACDVVVISDTSQFAPGQPAITYGLRGLVYFELTVSGPLQDLHSGTFGGAVMNPLIALSRLLHGLVDDKGTIQVPGFYDDVVPLRAQERAEFATLPFDEAAWMGRLGIPAVHGETGYTTLERRWARPTFDVHGLTGGYQGPGKKTVLPARGSAKFSFRLVPNQSPQKIEDALRDKLARDCPTGVRWELQAYHGNRGITVPFDSPYVAAASQAIELGFGKRPVLVREGGSIPIVNALHDHLHADTLLLGWGLDDDNTHSPNEKFCLADFAHGIRASLHL
ncbi:MAG: dipeptidase, partial [Planctomycetota bacterium]|nr:dipeptidase [Planctomycetota bacterium]